MGAPKPRCHEHGHLSASAGEGSRLYIQGKCAFITNGQLHRSNLVLINQSFNELYDYSVNNRAPFWDFCWKYFRLIHSGTYTRVVDETAPMNSIPRWFEGIRLNFAENLLFTGVAGDTTGKEDDRIAITEVREGAAADQAIHLTWGELRQRTASLMQAMRENGVQKGDRIAVCAANSIDTLLVFLAATGIGAIFSSSSTDMGVKGILDRLLQIMPRWLFMDDQAVYNGKTVDLRGKMRDIIKEMQSVREFEGIISVPRFTSQPADISSVPKAWPLADFLAKAALPDNSLQEFERVGFGDPFLIVYSSGTTGKPKCIVHSVGGVLMNARKEGGLHQELGPDSVALQYTTTNWIMYMSAVQTLVFGSRVVLYDGSPFLPEIASLIKLAARERVTHFGISPRYLYELQRSHIKPREMADLSSLQVVSSTGMVLSDELFEWFYDHGFPTSVRLNNMSGGTDIAGCFGIGNSLLPVYVSGCAGFSLGVPVEVYDSTIEGGNGVRGVRVEEGIPGELVAVAAFPNMPISFWGPNGDERYHNAYFARFESMLWPEYKNRSMAKLLQMCGRMGILSPSTPSQNSCSFTAGQMVFSIPLAFVLGLLKSTALWKVGLQIKLLILSALASGENPTLMSV